NFCAAADEILYASTLVAAPLAVGKDRSCVLIGVSAAVLANPIRMRISTDDPARLDMGRGMASAINNLFGATVVSVVPLGSNPTNSMRAFLLTPPDGALDDWDMATGYWSLPGPSFPDHLERLYGSLKASDQCGGIMNGQPQNYGFVCIPDFDTQATAATLAPDTSTLASNALAALNVFGNHVATIPVYERGARFLVLRTMAGAVN